MSTTPTLQRQRHRRHRPSERKPVKTTWTFGSEIETLVRRLSVDFGCQSQSILKCLLLPCRITTNNLYAIILSK